MPKKTPPPSKARLTQQKDAARAIASAVKRSGFDPQTLANGLAQAIFGFDPGLLGIDSGFGTELSQDTTWFRNIRGYLLSNNRQLMNYIYAEFGPIKNAVDVPVDDALRGGVSYISKQLSPVQLEELKNYIEQENVLHGGNGQAERWNRLFGGAGVLPIVAQDPESVFEIASLKVGAKVDFRAVDMWELYYDKQAVEGYDPAPIPMNDPLVAYYRYYGHNLHKSRVMKLTGVIAPSFLRPRLRGWGMSITENMVRSVNQYLKATNVAFEVLDEFKVDIFGISGLNETMQNKDGEALVRSRVALTNRSKNYKNAVVLDALDQYNQKQLTFSGLADVMREIRMQVASDLRMPMTKLFGISASGFSSGEDDLETYNGMVESDVRMKMKHHIIKSGMIACQVLFGVIPTDLNIEWAPLRVLSSKDQEEVRDKQFNRLISAFDKGLISVKEFKDAVNKGKLLGIQIDADAPLEDTMDFPREELEPGTDDPANKPAALGLTPKERAMRNSGQPVLTRELYDELSREQKISSMNQAATVLMNPGTVDEAKWSEAKEASQAAFGRIKWPFVTWFYKHHGGTFS